MCNCNNQYVLHPELEMLLNEEYEYDYESPSKPKFTRKSTLPDNCKDERDITMAFRQFISDAKALVPRITQPPVTKKIIDEIDHITGPEGGVDITRFKVFSCSKIINLLVFGETIAAEVLPAPHNVLRLAAGTWDLRNQFLNNNDLGALTELFQIIAHEKRHAVIDFKIDPTSLRKGMGGTEIAQAEYRIEEILCKAEEIAVGKTMLPGYKVPTTVPSLIRKHWNILLGMSSSKGETEFRELIKKELRKRYLSGKGCDGPMLVGVLNSMDFGQWFLCDRGSVILKVKDKLNLCKGRGGGHQICNP